MLKKLVILPCLLFISCSSQNNYGLKLENDIVGGSDQNYTHGTFFFNSVDADKASKTLRKVAETIPSVRLFSTDPENITRIRTKFGQEMHTPDDLREEEIIENDNPYAGYLFGELSRVNATKNFKLESGVAVGLVGPHAYAGEVQTFVHKDLDMGADPQGWKHQLKDEPTLNLHYIRAKKWEQNEYLDLISKVQFRLGTVHTDLLYSNGLQCGYNPPNFDGSHSADISAYGFGNINLNLVGRNMFYDGNLFRSSPHSVSSRHFVGQFETGVGVSYEGYSAKFRYIISSKQFEEQQNDFHSYGGITFGVDW
jgi:hypothetical protein